MVDMEVQPYVQLYKCSEHILCCVVEITCSEVNVFLSPLIVAGTSHTYRIVSYLTVFHRHYQFTVSLRHSGLINFRQMMLGGKT